MPCFYLTPTQDEFNKIPELQVSSKSADQFFRCGGVYDGSEALKEYCAEWRVALSAFIKRGFEIGFERPN